MERRKPPRGTAGQNFEKTECFESMVLKHHTLNPFDRKPQGAVATGGQVRLRLTVEDEQAPVELFCVSGMAMSAVIPCARWD